MDTNPGNYITVGGQRLGKTAYQMRKALEMALCIKCGQPMGLQVYQCPWCKQRQILCVDC